jgi:hypothetical protein
VGRGRRAQPWVDNPRANDKAVAQVAKSIKRFGFGAPVLARRANGAVIAGHTRLKAAIRLGLKKVPVRYLDLDPADAHLLALADNKVGELADWDNDKLAATLHQLKAEDQDLIDGTGLGGAELRFDHDGNLNANAAPGKLINLQGGDRSVARFNDQVDCGTLLFTPSPPTLTYVPPGDAPQPTAADGDRPQGPNQNRQRQDQDELTAPTSLSPVNGCVRRVTTLSA